LVAVAVFDVELAELHRLRAHGPQLGRAVPGVLRPAFPHPAQPLHVLLGRVLVGEAERRADGEVVDFLRLLIVLSAQPPADDGEIQAVVRRVREHALDLLRTQIAAAFGDDPHSPVTDRLARFALAAIDGAFVACQADHGVTLERMLQPLAASLAAARRALLARAD
jgi:hypothetical protein